MPRIWADSGTRRPMGDYTIFPVEHFTLHLHFRRILPPTGHGYKTKIHGQGLPNTKQTLIWPFQTHNH